MKNKNYLIPKNDPFILNKKLLTNFEKRAKNENSGFRILSHFKKNKKLHQMIINHKKNYKIKTHRNNKSPKSYFLIKGKMDIIYFKNKASKKKIIKLDNNCRFVRFEKSWFHKIIIKSNNVIFIETILGPHKKTKFYKF
tara:strand:+ start:14540 stop:14956 length:417 start_codon:yes stop_codon:yes gene_type:complete